MYRDILFEFHWVILHEDYRNASFSGDFERCVAISSFIDLLRPECERYLANGCRR
jgi:hypothetical protein